MTDKETKDAEVEDTIQPEPFALFMLDMFWWIFKQAVLAACFLYLGYIFGYRAGWSDLAAEIRAALKLQPQQQSGSTDESI